MSRRTRPWETHAPDDDDDECTRLDRLLGELPGDDQRRWRTMSASMRT